jgi:hypothetical protein
MATALIINAALSGVALITILGLKLWSIATQTRDLDVTLARGRRRRRAWVAARSPRSQHRRGEAWPVR